VGHTEGFPNTLSVAYLREQKVWEGNPNIPAQDGHLSPFTITGQVRTIKTFASWLCKEGHTRDHMLKRLSLPQVPKPLTMPLTEQKIQRIFSCLNTKTRVGARDYTMILLFLDTGIPASELCDLPFDHVRPEKEPGWMKVRGKRDKERIVDLGRVAQHAPLTYQDLGARGDIHGPLLCDNARPGHNRRNSRACRTEVAERSGVQRLHAHLFRHTAATQYPEAGGDAAVLEGKDHIQIQLGR